jgi:hypothetical protein
MNQRLKQLMLDAGYAAPELAGRAQVLSDLILTEVIDILATYRMRVIFEDGFEYNCQHPIYAIRDHFGMK